MPVEAVFFDASNKDGWYFTLGTAQRKNNIINLFFIVRIPGKGTFICPEMLTDTNVPVSGVRDSDSASDSESDSSNPSRAFLEKLGRLKVVSSWSAKSQW